MTIGGYNVDHTTNPEGNQKDLDRDCYGENSLHHNFVTVIPVDYPRQKYPSYNNQNFSSQEDIRSYPVALADKDRSEMSSIASVSTQSSHVMNRGISGAAADKPALPRIPNGQCKFSAETNLICFLISNVFLFSLCFSEQWHLRLRRC